MSLCEFKRRGFRMKLVKAGGHVTTGLGGTHVNRSKAAARTRSKVVLIETLIDIRINVSHELNYSEQLK